MSDIGTAFSHAVLACTSGWALHMTNGFSGQFAWSHICFGICLVHSVVGILEYSGEHVGGVYNFTRFCRNVFAFPCFVVHQQLAFGMQKELAYLHVAFCVIPLLQRLSHRYGADNTDLVDLIILGNVLSLGYFCCVNENYYGLDAALTYAFSHFAVRNSNSYLDIPAVDFNNYVLCFFVFFCVKAMKS